MTNAQNISAENRNLSLLWSLRVEKAGSLWKVRDGKNTVHAVAESESEAIRLRDKMMKA